MNSKIQIALTWLIGSALVSLLTALALPKGGGGSHATDDREALASLSGSLGSGLSVAALGGYRNVAANLVWISMYGDWRYKLKDEVLEKMNLAVSLNPDSIYYWIDGSRIIANDMPVWEVGDLAMESLFKEPDGIAVRKRYGEEALAFLEGAPESIKSEVPFLIEQGAIAWRRLDDLDRALPYFELAIEDEEVPYYVCRVYAELLYRNGEKEKALRYLKSHYDSLPDKVPAARKEMVLEKIRQLEEELD